jgi:hypothetical protein
MENKTGTFWKSALNHGVIFGIILIIIQLVMWMMNIIPVGIAKGLLTLLISLIIYVVAIILFIKNYRDKNLGGLIPFGKAFLYGFAVFMIATVIGSIFNFIFLTFIDPEYTQRVIKITAEWTEDFMRSKGVPEEQITQALDKIESKKIPTALGSSVKSLIPGAVMGAIVCLISAAIAKKEEADPFKDVR